MASVHRLLDYHPLQKSNRRWLLWLILVILLVAGAFGVLALELPRAGSHPTNNQAKCQSNLRQIGQGILAYATSHGGQFPDSFQTFYVNQTLFSSAVFICPGSDDEAAGGNTPSEVAASLAQSNHLSYIYLGSGRSLATVKNNQILVYERPDNHQESGMNILFGDGHAEWFDLKRGQALIASAIACTQPNTAK